MFMSYIKNVSFQVGHQPRFNASPRHALTAGVLGALLLFLCAATEAKAAGFRFQSLDEKSLGLWEGAKPVLVYNHGVMRKDGVPADRARSTYLHPIYGLDGEVLTDDFPKDHYHHRGLFWAWPHVKTGGKEYDLWMIKGVEQRFERWVAKEAGKLALLKVENGWYAGSKKIMGEQVTFQVHPVQGEARAIDVELVLTPLEQPLTLAGAEGKSYGGLTLRFAPRTNTVITTPLGDGKEDLPMTRLPWADLTAQFPGTAQPSGAAIFVAKSHPDFPPMWLTRHYGVLCLGWPGVDARTFEPDKPIRLRYRVWVHRGAADADRLKKAFELFEQAGT
ncbi:MAG: hypothetical protein EHM35_16045 [Planctomycetaceae bacterium]|nr:MAG: hypothetical protein EHM35_16045 [Planctomycetaceae bacterium]